MKKGISSSLPASTTWQFMKQNEVHEILYKTNEEREKIKKGNGGVLYCIHNISQYLATNSYSKGQHGTK